MAHSASQDIAPELRRRPRLDQWPFWAQPQQRERELEQTGHRLNFPDTITRKSPEQLVSLGLGLPPTSSPILSSGLSAVWVQDLIVS